MFNSDSVIKPEKGYDFLTDDGAQLNGVHLISASNDYNGLHIVGGYHFTCSDNNITHCNIFGYTYLSDGPWNVRYLINIPFDGIRNATYNLLLSKFSEKQLEKLIELVD